MICLITSTKNILTYRRCCYTPSIAQPSFKPLRWSGKMLHKEMVKDWLKLLGDLSVGQILRATTWNILHKIIIKNFLFIQIFVPSLSILGKIIKMSKNIYMYMCSTNKYIYVHVFYKQISLLSYNRKHIAKCQTSGKSESWKR